MTAIEYLENLDSKLIRDQSHILKLIEYLKRNYSYIPCYSARKKLGLRNEKLVGSSEVIESVFGKLKRIEGDQKKSGFTGNVLSVCAMVSKTTLETIKKAMETITTPCLNDWCMENLGDSIQCQRKKFSNHVRKWVLLLTKKG